MKTGLVLEGGGMRGIYTVGALDVFLEQNIYFDYIIGVSAGAGNAVSYISKQKGRGYRCDMNYIHDERYIGKKPWHEEKSVFGLNFIYDILPTELEPLDFEAFYNDPAEFVTVATDAATGEAVYFGKEHIKNQDTTVLKASASLPIFSPPISYHGKLYYDGGVADSIPVHRAVEDGCDKLVIILTKPHGYRKKPMSFKHLYSAVLKDYPKVVEAMEHRHEVYNASLDYAYELEKEGKAVIIAPEYPLTVDKFTSDTEKLEHCYQEGIRDTNKVLERIQKLLG